MPRKNGIDYNPNKICSVKDCNENVARLEWCRRHYRFNRLYGDPNYKGQIRFKSKPDLRKSKDCTSCKKELPIESFSFRNETRRQSTCKECVSISNICRLYNITQEQYAQMFINQNNKCAICKRERRLFVDHDHKCCLRGSCGNCIRGLLCASCNTAIGALQEDPAMFATALKYLRNANAT